VADKIIQEIEVKGTVEGAEDVAQKINEVREAAEALVNTVEDTAKNLNIDIDTADSVEKVDALAEGLNQLGIASTESAKLIAQIKFSLNRTRGVFSASAKAIEDFGISLLDASGQVRFAEDVLTDLVAKLNEIPDPTERAAAAASLLGENVERVQMDNFSAEVTGVINSFADFINAIFGVTGALGQMGSNISGTISAVVGLADGFKKAIIPITKFVAVIGAIPTAGFLLSKSAAENAKDLDNLAVTAGITTDQFADLAGVFGQFGTSQSQFSRSMVLINQQMGRAREEGVSSVGAFEELGITLIDSGNSARSAADVLADVADKIAAIENPTERANTVARLFGRQVGSTLTPALALGSARIREMADEFNRLAPNLTAAEIKLGKEMTTAVFLATSAFQSLKDSIGIALSPIFTQAAQAFAQALSGLRPVLIELAETLATAVGPALADVVRLLAGNTAEIETGWIFLAAVGFRALGTAVGSAAQLILNSLQGIIIILNQVARLWNFVFGTEITGADILMTAILFRWLNLWGLFVASIRLGAAAVGLFNAAWAATPVGRVLALAAALGAVVGWLAAHYWTDFVAVLQTTIAFFTDRWNAAVAGVTAAFQSLNDRVAGVMASIQGIIDRTIERVRELIKTLLEAVGLGASSGGAGGGSFARGGPVFGSGTATSDSIPAWLSNGEFVMRSAAVRKFGLGFMHAINSLSFPDIGTKFNMGGAVESMGRMPARMAEGGPVQAPGPSGRPISLHLGDEVFDGLTAPEDVADRLVRYARGRSMRSAGKKPSWFES
jgi:hypothetical protein